MKKRKSLQELTFKDNFMFLAVMQNPENCKGVLERILEIEIERIEVSEEKTIAYNPESKSIRMDIYAKDEHNTHYDVEMQMQRKKKLCKRARYYHSEMDVDALSGGEAYEKLPNTYVIFICDFDPFGEKKYRYTVDKVFRENPEHVMDDGEYTIFLNTEGKNEDEVPEELVRFLEFVKAPLEESKMDFGDKLIAQLQNSVQEIKESREMGAKYLTIKEYVRDEYYWEFVEVAKRMLDKGMTLEDVCEVLDMEREDLEEALAELEAED